MLLINMVGGILILVGVMLIVAAAVGGSHGNHESLAEGLITWEVIY